MNSKTLLLPMLAIWTASLPAGPQQSARESELTEQVRLLRDEVKQLRGELLELRYEAAGLRVRQVRAELAALREARRRLDAQEAARLEELRETEDLLSRARANLEEREAAEAARYELGVTRPVEIATERRALDERERELDSRLAREERQRSMLRAQLETYDRPQQQ